MDEFPDDEEEFYEFLDPEDIDQTPPFQWTRHRILLLIVVIVIVVTFLAYAFSGLFAPTPPLPPPTIVPGSII